MSDLRMIGGKDNARLMRWLAYAAPLVVFILLAIFLYFGLGTDSRKIPSPLIGKPLPMLSLRVLDDPQQLWRSDESQGKVWLLNVWASWCTACRAEHPLLHRLAGEGAEIVGLNYKDEDDEAQQWLTDSGNPYQALPVDDGVAGLELGVYGVPETFIIDAAGLVRYKHIGPLTEEDLSQIIRPLLVSLRAEVN